MIKYDSEKIKDVIIKIEMELESAFDSYIRIKGVDRYYDKFQGYEICNAMELIYIADNIKFSADSVGDINLINIDGLLLKIDYSRTSLTIAEAITEIPQRRAEKILFELQHNKKPVEELDIEEAERGERVC